MDTRISIIVLGGLLLAGCGEQAPKRWEPTMENPPMRTFSVGKEMPVSEMVPDDVVVAVNGVALTKRGVDDRLRNVVWQLNRMKGGDSRQRAAYYNQFGMTLVEQFIRSQLLAQEGRRLKCLTREKLVAAVDKDVAKAMKKFRVKPEELDGTFAGGEFLLRSQAEDAQWAKAYVRQHVKRVVIPLSSISNMLHEVARENAVIAASNAMVRARLEKVLAEAKAPGADFGAISDKWNEDEMMEKNGTGLWGEFTLDEFTDEEFRHALEAMQIGQISGIVEDGEGYMFVKILDRTDDPKEPVYKLARVFMAKEDETVLADSDPKALKKSFEDQATAEETNARVEELRGAATIVYPHGTNFWNSAKKK